MNVEIRYLNFSKGVKISTKFCQKLKKMTNS